MQTRIFDLYATRSRFDTLTYTLREAGLKIGLTRYAKPVRKLRIHAMHCNVVAKMQCNGLEVLVMTYLMLLGIFRFFLVELQVLLFSLTMVAAFPILQQGDRLGWISIQN